MLTYGQDIPIVLHQEDKEHPSNNRIHVCEGFAYPAQRVNTLLGYVQKNRPFWPFWPFLHNMFLGVVNAQKVHFLGNW